MKTYRKTSLHKSLVPTGPVNLCRDGKIVRSFPSYEKAVKALDSAIGQGWSI